MSRDAVRISSKQVCIERKMTDEKIRQSTIKCFHEKRILSLHCIQNNLQCSLYEHVVTLNHRTLFCNEHWNDYRLPRPTLFDLNNSAGELLQILNYFYSDVPF